MQVEVNPSARIQVRGLSSLLAPATCALCGNGTRDKYVDPAIFIEWVGQLYFCTICTVEMAETIGCLSSEQSDVLVEVNQELSARVKELEEKVRTYEQLRSALVAGGFTLNDDSFLGSDAAITAKHAKNQRERNITNDEPTISREGPGAIAVKPSENTGRLDSARSTGSDKPRAHPERDSGLQL